jgi:hypothetical protein
VPIDDQLTFDLARMVGEVSPHLWTSGGGVEVEVSVSDGA